MAGEVFVENRKITKAGEMIPCNSKLIVKEDSCPYVSRGGLKLEKAIKVFNISLSNKICADIGSSTGGFTDCMLQNGASKVYSIDVGYGQLDWKLRNDKRVVVMERTNARYLDENSYNDKIDFASVDVSFISLKLIFPAIKASKISEVVALIKPQFEAGKENVGKNGVVRDPKVRENVINSVIKYAEDNGYYIDLLDFSPIKGPSGNIEFIAHFTTAKPETCIDVTNVVDSATEFFS